MKKVKISSFDISEYQIVTAVNSDFDTRQTAWRFQKLVKEECGIDIPNVVDAKVGAQKEIRIGKTMFTFPKKLALNEYYVEIFDDGTLQIAAGHYSGIVAAYNKIERLVKTCEECCEICEFSGTVDIPLTWKANPAACETFLSGDVDGNNKKSYAKNSEVLSDFDFNSDYTLVWNDEFSGDTIDLEKWVGCPNMRMPDVELFFEEPVVAVKDDKLILTSDCTNTTEGKPYSSNYTVATHDTMNFCGGYLEMRAKVPCKGLGEWPSFWLTSNDCVIHKQHYRDTHDGHLYNSEYRIEVDIFEQFSLPKNRFVPNLHKHMVDRESYEFFSPKTNSWVNFGGRQLSGIDQGALSSGTPTYIFPSDEIANDWHTYGFLWTDDLMAFSIDGIFYYAYSMHDSDKGMFNPKIRHKETGKIINLGMNGYQKENMALSVLINNMMFTPGYAKSPRGRWIADTYDDKGNRIVDWRELNLEDQDKLFPLVYEIDYVRLYQTKGDSLYTPYIVGEKTRRVFSGADPQWDYVQGRKTKEEMNEQK